MEIEKRDELYEKYVKLLNKSKKLEFIDKNHNGSVFELKSDYINSKLCLTLFPMYKNLEIDLSYCEDAIGLSLFYEANRDNWIGIYSAAGDECENYEEAKKQLKKFETLEFFREVLIPEVVEIFNEVGIQWKVMEKFLLKEYKESFYYDNLQCYTFNVVFLEK